MPPKAETPAAAAGMDRDAQGAFIRSAAQDVNRTASDPAKGVIDLLVNGAHPRPDIPFEVKGFDRGTGPDTAKMTIKCVPVGSYEFVLDLPLVGNRHATVVALRWTGVTNDDLVMALNSLLPPAPDLYAPTTWAVQVRDWSTLKELRRDLERAFDFLFPTEDEVRASVTGSMPHLAREKVRLAHHLDEHLQISYIAKEVTLDHNRTISHHLVRLQEIALINRDKTQGPVLAAKLGVAYYCERLSLRNAYNLIRSDVAKLK